MKIVAYQKPLLQRTGMIVIRKKITSGVFRIYYEMVFCVPYKSVAERKKLLYSIMKKHSIVSVIPDI